MDKKDLVKQRDIATAFAKKHLEQCCAELIKWSDTGILPDGKTREVMGLCAFATPSDSALAEYIIKRLALEFVVENWGGK